MQIELEDFEDFLDAAGSLAVEQRIRRLICLVIKNVEKRNGIHIDIRDALREYSNIGDIDLNELDEFAQRYEQQIEGDESYWLATLVRHNERLHLLIDDDYEEEVFFLLSILERFGCSEQVFYKTIMLDLDMAQIASAYVTPS